MPQYYMSLDAYKDLVSSAFEDRVEKEKTPKSEMLKLRLDTATEMYEVLPEDVKARLEKDNDAEHGRKAEVHQLCKTGLPSLDPDVQNL